MSTLTWYTLFLEYFMGKHALGRQRREIYGYLQLPDCYKHEVCQKVGMISTVWPWTPHLIGPASISSDFGNWLLNVYNKRECITRGEGDRFRKISLSLSFPWTQCISTSTPTCTIKGLRPSKFNTDYIHDPAVFLEFGITKKNKAAICIRFYFYSAILPNRGSHFYYNNKGSLGAAVSIPCHPELLLVNWEDRNRANPMFLVVTKYDTK